MKKGIVLIFSLILLRALPSMERTLDLKPGQAIGARILGDWKLRGLRQVSGYRGQADLIVSGYEYGAEGDPDILLHFNDEGEFAQLPWYDIVGTQALPKGFSRLAPGKVGPASARFQGQLSAISLKPRPGAMLANQYGFSDFTLEFWLRPITLRDGERIITWKAGRWEGKKYQSQSLSCTLAKGRMEWRLDNIFVPGSGKGASQGLRGRRLLVPGVWNHHTLRYDSATGLLEYLVDGVAEDSTHASADGHESQTLYVSLGGKPGDLILGQDYTGEIDEFRLSPAWVESPRLRTMPSEGGRVESPIIDLGSSGARLIQLDSIYRLASGQGLDFFLRASDGCVSWKEEDPPWRAIRPGKALAEDLRGRYVQIAVNLYPDAQSLSSPRLSLLSLRYLEDQAPPPPYRLVALARDGEVALSWNRVMDDDLGGYLVYYGEESGTYFGQDSSQGQSPIDVGPQTSCVIKGLRNGRLYFFVVSSYDGASPRHESEFSREVQARPTRTPQ